jgi:hypothetical protein
MISSEAQRTLVKSPPELWAELSDPDSLARHLGEFGQIRIVRIEPESAVEWEGEGVTGAVALKASGWGTKVTLTAERQPPALPEPEPAAEPERAAEPAPTLDAECQPVVEAESEDAEPEPRLEPEPVADAEPKLGFFARIFRWRRKLDVVPEAERGPAPEPEMHEAQEAQEEEQQPEEQPQPPEEQQPDIAAELLALEESTAAATTAVLTAVLDRLGAAHHRPFSRS